MIHFKRLKWRKEIKMKRKIITVILLTFISIGLFANQSEKDKIKLLYDIEEFKECIKESDKAIAENKNNYSKGLYYAIKAASYAKQKKINYSKSDEWADTAKKLAPSNPEMWAFLGAYESNKFISKNRVSNIEMAEKAEKYFRKAIALQSTNQRAYSLAADFYADLPSKVSLGNINFAISFDRRALMMKPDKLGLLGYYKMAKHLEKRNWSKSERKVGIEKINQQIQRESDSFSKNRYYEGFMPFAFVQNYYSNPWQSISSLSDKDEAMFIYKYIKKSAPNTRLGNFLKNCLKDI